MWRLIIILLLVIVLVTMTQRVISTFDDSGAWVEAGWIVLELINIVAAGGIGMLGSWWAYTKL